MNRELYDLVYAMQAKRRSEAYSLVAKHDNAYEAAWDDGYDDGYDDALADVMNEIAKAL